MKYSIFIFFFGMFFYPENISAQVDSVRVSEGCEITYDVPEAYVEIKNRYVKSGQKFQADIVVLPYDSTKNYEVIVNRKTFLQEKGVVKYEEITQVAGVKTIKGFIKMKQKKEIVELPFESKYTVYYDSALIAMDDANILYIHKDNHITIHPEGLSVDKILVKINEGKIVKNERPYGYTIIVERPAEIIVDVYEKLNDSNTKYIGSKIFKTRYFPKPYATLGPYKNRESVNLEYVKISWAVFTNMVDDYAFEEIEYHIISYDFTVISDGQMNSKTAHVNGYQLTKECTKMLKKMDKGDMIIISKILVKDGKSSQYLEDLIIYVN